ncbi:MAG: DNA replication/repair protein RecF [Actinomycetaceae bacterium]|nr:DNA replication/repair protein RecF [Actinomycetaceae bacterium]
MYVSHIALDDFRSYRHAVVELGPGATVLLGPNGQGKTNLVEAIGYLSTFSSHRVSADTALVRAPLNAQETPPGGAVIRVRLVSGDGRESVIELEIVRGKANRARVNRTQMSPRDILGMVRSVVFAPEDLSLVRGDPSIRRTFMDELATQMRPTYSRLRADFEKVARQRAALMKQAQSAFRRGRSPDLSTLSVWDDTFARLSAQVSAQRAQVIHALTDPSRRAHSAIAPQGRDLDMVFDPSVGKTLGEGDTTDLTDVDLQCQRILQAFAQVHEREIERGVNLVGAHRDDLMLTLGHLPVKGYASHGESWSVALALRLGAFEVLGSDGDQPILILDDVFAELDSARRQGLAQMVAGADQVLVTAAVADDVPELLGAQVIPVRWDAEEGTVVGNE